MKKELRKKIIKLRDLMDTETKIEYDSSISTKVLDNKYIKNSKIIFIFISFGSEVDTHSIIKDLIARGHTVCVPKVEGENMKAIEIFSLENLEKTKYALEPKSGTEIEVGDIEAILVPGVVFNKRGSRIGYGGGYYDRFMTKINKNCKKIALSYELQIIEEIPVDDWDIEVDMLITEEDIYNFN